MQLKNSIYTLFFTSTSIIYYTQNKRTEVSNSTIEKKNVPLDISKLLDTG